jgi:hypothetical protein
LWNYQGVSLGISRESLNLTEEEYRASLEKMDWDNGAVRFLSEMQKMARALGEEQGLAAGVPSDAKRDALSLARQMHLEIYRHLKTTVDAVFTARNRMTIRSSEAALRNCLAGLPRDASLIPSHGNPMEVFGLDDRPLDWSAFLRAADGQQREAWREAISHVVLATHAGRINVDNTQVIYSADGSKSYRVVLENATRYLDGEWEFQLYLVEVVRREYRRQAMRSIFLNYRRSDTEGETGRLFRDLADRFGKETVFIDVAAIGIGRDFREAIFEAVGGCGSFLAIIGRDWIDARNAAGQRCLDDPNDFVRLEIAAALKRGIPIIPVLVQGATMPDAAQLPDDLKEIAYRNCVELSHRRWDPDLELLIGGLLHPPGPAESTPAAGAE